MDVTNPSAQLICYRASAGAGKTHQIVSKYFSYLLQPEVKLDEVIVLTFTNKAAMELQERVLEALDLLINQPAKFAQTYQVPPPYEFLNWQKKGKTIRERLLLKQEKWNVKTLDTYFSHICQKFAFELNISHQSEALLTTSLLLDEATQTLLAEKELSFIWEKLVAEAVDQGKAWDLAPLLKNIGTELVTNLEKERPSKNGSWETSWEKIKKQVDHFSHYSTKKSKELYEMIGLKGWEATDFKWQSKGLMGWLPKALLKPTPPNNYVKELLDPSKKWGAARSTKKSAIDEFVKIKLYSRLKELLESYEQHYTTHVTYQLLAPLQYSALLQQHLRKKIEQYCQKNRFFFFAPMQQKLGKEIANLPGSWYASQMNNQPKHWLIDEFQDLSLSQWAFLHPLLEKSMNSGYESMIVGDVKQAIYRWRGGEPELFLKKALKEIGEERVSCKNLSYNWRSDPVIISFNNIFFEKAAAKITKACSEAILSQKNLPTPIAQRALEDSQQILKAYAQLHQKPPASTTTKKGEVRVTCLITESNKERWQDLALKKAIQSCERLQEKGLAPDQITWLVRNNQEAQTILKGLQNYSLKKSTVSYLATTARATSMGSQPIILLVMTTLQLLQKPENPWLNAKLLYYYGLIHPKKIATLSIKKSSLSATLKELLPTFQNQLIEWQLTALKKNLFSILHFFQLENCAISASFLTHALEVVEKKQAQGGGLKSLLNWWEKEGKKINLALDKDPAAMQILTIHQAKGLAFDAVLIPFGKWNFDHPTQHPPLQWHQTNQVPFNTLGKMPCYYSTQLQKTHYQLSYYQEKHKQYLEQLNLLYVAFTRPKHYLHIWLPKNEQKRIKETAALIQQLLPLISSNASSYKEEKDSLEYIWGKTLLREKKKETPPVAKSNPIKRAASQMKPLAEKLSLPGDTRGEWWHELFSHIYQQGDEKKRLSFYYKQRSIDSIAPYSTLFQELWQHPKIGDWFSGSWKVKTECSLHTSEGTLRLDRVHQKGNELIVLDYKTGKEKAADKRQLQVYKSYLSSMGYQPISLYLLYIKIERPPFTFHLVPVT